MPEEAKQTEGKAEEPKAETKPSKGGLLKYIIMASAALVIIIVVAFGVALVMKGDSSSSADEGATSSERPPIELKKPDAKTSQHAQAEGDGSSEPVDSDEGIEELDESAIEKIMNNLAFLDYEPTEDELAVEEGRMTKEDSVEQVNWIDKEKSALAARQKELDSRERELKKLESKINQSLLKIEQAESARTANLAKLYDGMDPRAVANLLGNLDDATVVSILPRMKLKNASAVLQLMPAQRAAKLSKQMITVAEK